MKKSIWKSRTLWGIAIILAGRYIDIPPELKETLPDSIPFAIEQIITGLGTLLAIYGRLKADKNLTLPWKK